MIWLASFAASWMGRAWIIGGGIAALFVAYKSVQYGGVKKERARVVKEAVKTDAKAAVRKRTAEREPDRVLERYYRD